MLVKYVMGPALVRRKVRLTLHHGRSKVQYRPLLPLVDGYTSNCWRALVQYRLTRPLKRTPGGTASSSASDSSCLKCLTPFFKLSHYVKYLRCQQNCCCTSSPQPQHWLHYLTTWLHAPN